MRDLDLHALFLFNVTDTMAQPWADAGITCWCVDLQHPKGERREGNIIRVGADVLRYTPPMRRYVFGFAFPPCTDLAVSGARWFAGKGLYALADAITLFARAAEVMEALDAPYGIENPVSTISSYWRKPDYSFDPCDYAGYHGGEGDTYTKKTCLWTGGGLHHADAEAPGPVRWQPHAPAAAFIRTRQPAQRHAGRFRPRRVRGELCARTEGRSMTHNLQRSSAGEGGAP